jgi:uncharacterized membrane protein
MLCKNCGQDNPPEASFCSKCGAALATTITLVPGVESSYTNGWKQLWKHFLALFLIGIIYFVISLPFSIIQWITGGYFPLSFLSIAYSFLIVAPVSYGLSFAFLKAAREDKVEIQDMFAGFKNYWNAVAASILVSIIVVIGFILLIVPGIFLACKLVFVPYLVVDRKMRAIDAIKESWRMTSGHAWKVFLIGLIAIPVVIAGLICFGVGVIISIMWVSMALASLYHAVSASGAAPKQLTPTSPPTQST